MATSENDLTEQLRNLELFAGVSDRHLKRIARQMREFTFAEGDKVVADDDQPSRGGRMFVILDGTAEVRRNDELIATLGPGEHFGEMALLDGGPRSAAVVATSSLRTATLASWNFNPILTEEPEIALAIIKSLVARLRAANEPR